MKKGLRRVAVVAVTTLVAAPALATVASATSTFAFDRLAGADRYATSVAVATSYGASTNVILASGVPGHYPDALTASYLAGVKNAPIMLTQLAATPTNVVNRITASGATDIWLIGGTGVISAAQETALDAKFGTVHRLGGLDRYLTAEKVIGEGGASATTAVLATGVNFPDAIAGGPLAYVKDMPLAITATNTLPAATLRSLKAAGVTKVIALGGPTVITPAVLAALAAQGITLDQRIFGANRSETSSKLADYMLASQGFTNTGINVASGYAFGTGADALGGAPLSGKENRPTLITESVTTVGPGPLGFLTAHAATLATGHIFGGLGAVSQSAEDAMEAAARSAASNQTYSVSPTTAATIALDATTLFRQYTVATGAATQVDIQLYPAASVTTTGNTVTFADTNSDNIADPGSPVGEITVVNGVGNTGTRANNVTPVAGAVTFTVQSAAAGSVIPVVYADANASNSLNLVVPTVANALPKQPSEAFGIGGATTWTPVQAASEAFAVTAPNVMSADKAVNSFVADPSTVAGTGTFTYFYDSNDTFRIDGVPATMTSFEAALSTGDGMDTGSVYTRDPAASSVFLLLDVAPAAPASLVASSITTTSVVLTVPTPAADVAVRIYQGLSTAATRATAVKVADTTTDADLALAGFQVNITGLAATTSYEFWATYVQDGDESPLYPASDTGTVVDTSTAPALIVVASAPFASTIAIADNDANNALTSGDAVTITFNEPMAVPAAGATITLTDGDGTISTVTNGTGSTFTRSGATNQVITVALGAAASTTAPGTTAGLQFATAAVSDTAGVLDSTSVLWSAAAASAKQGGATCATPLGVIAVPGVTAAVPFTPTASADAGCSAGTITSSGAADTIVGATGSVVPGALVTVSASSNGALVGLHAVANSVGGFTIAGAVVIADTVKLTQSVQRTASTVIVSAASADITVGA